MFRKLMPSVRKSSRFCLDVPKLVSLHKRMDRIMMRGCATTMPSVPQKLQPVSGSATDTTNGRLQNLRAAQRQPTFEELVFHPTGSRCTYTDQDTKRIALENAAYNNAIVELCKLQPNREAIRTSITDAKLNCTAHTVKYLERSGLSLTTVEQLSTIHVAGTKGKGSTCALTESILRQYGARTGFFSSPHLLSTNERIRINGDPLEKHKFTHYFWQVYNRLKEQREHENDMPAFFMFLTILGFHVFVAERVDVLVLEVGMGGEMDCTNILRNVRTAGITSLALEHTALLGKTLKEIAWQKAGIMKPGAHVYTHVTQPECLQVIYERAAERKANVIEVLSTEAYFKYNLYADYLDSCNDYVRLNGALAIQLAYDWLRQTQGPLHHDYLINEINMSAEVLRGLSNAHWPGRCQLVEFQNMRLHLDGAHTVESIRVCCDWFQKSTRLSSQNPKILIFNRTGDSDTKEILLVLQQSCAFDMICFVPNLATAHSDDPNQTTLYCSADMQKERAQSIAGTWQQLCDATKQPNHGQMYNTLTDAFTTMRQRYPNNMELDVLITGSIHLLGAAISALNDFNLVEREPTITTTTAAAADTSTTAATTAVDTSAITATTKATTNGHN